MGITKVIPSEIALWCNGSTPDSGSVCESSSLSKATFKYPALWCNGSTPDSGSVCESSSLSKATSRLSNFGNRFLLYKLGSYGKQFH